MTRVTIMPVLVVAHKYCHDAVWLLNFNLNIFRFPSQFKCCGVYNYTDFYSSKSWKKNRTFEVNGVNVMRNLTTPIACCKMVGTYPDAEPVNDTECAFQPNMQNSNYNKVYSRRFQLLFCAYQTRTHTIFLDQEGWGWVQGYRGGRGGRDSGSCPSLQEWHLKSRKSPFQVARTVTCKCATLFWKFSGEDPLQLL